MQQVHLRWVNTPEKFSHHFAKGDNYLWQEVTYPVFETFQK